MFSLGRWMEDVMVTPLIALRRKWHRQQEGDGDDGYLNWGRCAHEL